MKPIVLRITTITIMVKETLIPRIKFLITVTQTIQAVKRTEDLDQSTHPVRPAVKLTLPQRKVTLEQTQRTDPVPGTDDRKDKTMSNREMPKAIQMGRCQLHPKP